MTPIVCEPPSTKLAAATAARPFRSGVQLRRLDARLCPVPRLGFSGYVISGTGQYVLSVDHGSTAARIGLRPGDVILALNGCPLSHEDAWQEAMFRAVGGDGKLTVRIRQGQTGRIAHRTCHLFWPAGAPAG